MNSKVKFSKFYLIIDLSLDDEKVDVYQVYLKISAAIKKAVSSHKLGEAGFKPNASGSYFNAFENVNESFKILEDAINSTGLNSGDHKYLQIGINTDNNNHYISDQNKYDIDGPKTLYDQ